MGQFNLDKYKTSKKEAVVAEDQIEMCRPKAKKDVRANLEQVIEGLNFVEYGSKAYLVSDGIIDEVPGRFTADLVLAQTSDGKLILWIRRHDIPSAAKVIEEASKAWRRIEWSNSQRKYEALAPSAKHPEPDWPDKSIEELVADAARGRVIESVEHKVVKRLKEREQQKTR